MSNLEGIAIVGIAARFPGARDAEELWRNLRDGVESVAFFSEEELAAAGVDPGLLADPRYVRAKGVLEDADLFDAAFFGFTPREAEAMDPQHRVFLECAWEALEDAGYDPERSGGRIGLYAGSGISSYLISNLLPNQGLVETLGGLQALLLNDRDFFVTRAAYELNLRGPSVTVQTACSTSLVAVHMACQSLLAGECDLALAGGVSISSPLRSGYLYQEGSVMSPDGHCRAFDAAAAGAVEGNGCGVVVLKRLADALADGDPVRAVIRGSAINNDGSGKVGFTAPSVEGQAGVISEALMMAGVEPGAIGYVEAHGSGTPMGDPIEVAALNQVFAGAGTASCALGSVKTNLGHCNTAAGAAGLIKTALALAHRTLPPSLHFERPNPQAGLEGSPFYVCTRATPWETDGTPRRAGVSSFGLGGTNAHLVLEEAPEAEPGDLASRSAQLLVLSARTPAALDAAATRLADHLEAHPGLELADVAWTLQVGRRGFEHWRAVVAGSPEEAVAALRDPARGVSAQREGQGSRPVVFLFPGLGDQYVDMARELYEVEPLFREQVDHCAGKLRPWLGADLREVMFSPGSWAPKEEGRGPDLRAMLRRNGPAEASRLHQTLFAQPACFVIEYALARLLMDWGLEPEAMIGYSLGEYVAACLAGALSLDDSLELVARRAKLIQELPAGAMLAVPLPEEEVQPLLGQGLALSATNGPHFCVVGGPAEAVEALDRRLSERGASCLRLQTTHAFHTPMMESAATPFSEIARRIRMETPRIPWLSNVTGTWITSEDLADPDYWVRHMAGTVRFAEGLGELLAEPGRVFLEVGPGATLATLAKQHPAAPSSLTAAATLRRAGEGRSDVEHLLEAVGRLWTAGVEVDWSRFHGGECRRRVPLPTYPFERQRYWLDPPAAPRTEKARSLEDWFWVPVWKQAPPVPRFAEEETGGRWLIFANRDGLGERVAERLRKDGHAVATVTLGPRFDASGDRFTIDPARREDYEALLAEPPSRVLHLWGVTEGEPSFDEAQEMGLLSLVCLHQAVEAVRCPRLHVLVVANGLHEVLEGDPIHPAKATVLGAVRVIRQESERLACGTLDVVPGEARLIERLLEEVAEPVPAAAWRGGRRWVRNFEPLRLPEEAAGRSRLGGECLVIAPEQGPGRVLAEALARALGFQVAEALPQQGKPQGVVYTGGSFGGGLAQLKTPESLRAALEPLRDAEALLGALAERPEPPAFVVLSSSTPAVSGGLGQLELAAAGAFLEALAARQASQGGPFTVAVHWDPYQWDGWLAAGAAAGMSLQSEEVRLRTVPSARSAEALRRLLAASAPQVAVTDRDLRRLVEEADKATAGTLLEQIAPVRTARSGRTGLSRPYEPPRDELEESLAILWQDLFGMEPIGVEDGFLELGGHSLLAIQMATQLRSRFQVDLPVTVVFEAPTIAELAALIRRQRGEADPGELETLLALVEGLSPEEALRRMEELTQPWEEVAP